MSDLAAKLRGERDGYRSRNCEIKIVDAPAAVAAKVGMRRSGRFVKRTIGARQGDFGDQAVISKFCHRSIDGREANARPSLARERMKIGHGKVRSYALLLDDLVHQSMVFREPGLDLGGHSSEDITIRGVLSKVKVVSTP